MKLNLDSKKNNNKAKLLFITAPQIESYVYIKKFFMKFEKDFKIMLYIWTLSRNTIWTCILVVRSENWLKRNYIGRAFIKYVKITIFVKLNGSWTLLRKFFFCDTSSISQIIAIVYANMDFFYFRSVSLKEVWDDAMIFESIIEIKFLIFKLFLIYKTFFWPAYVR